MKIISVKGICLSETNYSESSKILNIYTEEYGMIGVMSKSCRNIRSKLRAVSRKLLYGTYHLYYKEHGLSTLIGVDVINGYLKTTMHLESVSYATYLIDLTYQVVRQGINGCILPLLIATLEKIEEGMDPGTITNIYEVKMLSYLGVLPNLDGCVLCGNSKDIVTISSQKGGLLCKNCYQPGVDRLLSLQTIKLLRMYYYVDISKISKIEIDMQNERELDIFLEEYYEKYTGVITKSKKMLREIKKSRIEDENEMERFTKDNNMV